MRLHRMRTSEALIEVRDRDLSFSVDETGLFLSEFGIRLTHEELELVQQRSEGWVAGLQMAAISMHHTARIPGVADRVEIARHTVAGYFLDEVLYRQPGRWWSSCWRPRSSTTCPWPPDRPGGTGSGPRCCEQVYRDHLFLTVVDHTPGPTAITS